MADDNSVMIEDARLIFKNFEGKESQYNSAGDRNFCVLLDAELAAQLANDGWNVKSLAPQEEGDPEQYYIAIKVSYKGRPPRVVMITSGGRQNLSEDMVSVLDWADIETADLIFRPYEWAVNGKTGIKAYLQSLFVTIKEDALERKYGINNTPDSGDET